jgi:hypothetical protein
MHEDIFAVLTRDEAETLRVIKPLHSSLFHFVRVSCIELRRMNRSDHGRILLVGASAAYAPFGPNADDSVSFCSQNMRNSLPIIYVFRLQDQSHEHFAPHGRLKGCEAER